MKFHPQNLQTAEYDVPVFLWLLRGDSPGVSCRAIRAPGIAWGGHWQGVRNAGALPSTLRHAEVLGAALLGSHHPFYKVLSPSLLHPLWLLT